MDDVDSLLMFRDVEDSVFDTGVDTDLVDTRAHERHRLPVIRHQTLLNAPQLVASLSSGVLRKSAKVIERRPKPTERLLKHDGVYTFLYVAASCLTRHAADGAFGLGAPRLMPIAFGRQEETNHHFLPKAAITSAGDEQHDATRVGLSTSTSLTRCPCTSTSAWAAHKAERSMRVDQMLMRHLMMGGAAMDAVGRQIVQRYIEKVSGYDKNLRKVIDEGEVTLDELGIMYAAVIDDLMPEPLVYEEGLDGAELVFVPTVFLLDANRLRDLVVGVSRDARGGSLGHRSELLVNQAVEQGRLIRGDPDSLRGLQRGTTRLQITPEGGFQEAVEIISKEKRAATEPSRSGCAEVLLLFLLFVAVAAWLVSVQ